MPTVCVSPANNWIEPDVDPCDATLPWILDMTCCPIIDPADEAQALIALRMKAAAIDVINQRTCRVYTCSVIPIRPCVDCACGPVCYGACGDFRYLDITMWGPGPVVSIATIKVDGVVIAGTNYWLDGNRLIPLRDGELWCWPTQDRNLPATEARTWEVTYVRGRKPPEILRVAAADLACQLIKWCLDAPCDLPANAVSVTREGVSISLETGLLSIPSVKIALDTYPPCDKFRGSRFVDPVNYGAML